jgi:hypothetical protein
VVLHRTAIVDETTTVVVLIAVPDGLTDEQITALVAGEAYKQYTQGSVHGEWEEQDSDTLTVVPSEVTFTRHTTQDTSWTSLVDDTAAGA